jgi:hypothetical protein
LRTRGRGTQEVAAELQRAAVLFDIDETLSTGGRLTADAGSTARDRADDSAAVYPARIFRAFRRRIIDVWRPA